MFQVNDWIYKLIQQKTTENRTKICSHFKIILTFLSNNFDYPNFKSWRKFRFFFSNSPKFCNNYIWNCFCAKKFYVNYTKRKRISYSVKLVFTNFALNCFIFPKNWKNKTRIHNKASLYRGSKMLVASFLLSP